jgi:hypothetical protein
MTTVSRHGGLRAYKRMEMSTSWKDTCVCNPHTGGMIDEQLSTRVTDHEIYENRRTSQPDAQRQQQQQQPPPRWEATQVSRVDPATYFP